MGYPTSWRRGRSSPQRGGLGGAPAPYDWRGPVWLMSAAAAWWAGRNLQQAFQTAVQTQQDVYRPSPVPYGWTKLVECNKTGAAVHPSANFAFCAVGQLANFSQWATPYPPTASIITEKHYDSLNGAGTLVVYSVARTWQYNGTGFARRYPVAVFPGRRAPGRVFGSTPISRTASLTDVGYHPTEEGYVGYSNPRFWFRPNWRWDIFVRVIVDQEGTRPLPRPVVVPRAIPIALTKELKVNTHTAAGRTFVTMLMAWNFMGDTWGLVGALWRALPRQARGRSRRLGAMLNDLFRGWRYFNPYMEKNQSVLLNAAMNVALWKFSDTVMGGAQKSLFDAQTEVAGVMYARVWASLDSHGRAQAQSLVRTFSERGREQNSHRGG